MQPFLCIAAQQHASHPALIAGGTTCDFATLWQQAQQMAAAWQARGIRAGDRVALLLPGGLAYVVCVHAANLLGVTLVLLNTRLTAPELDYQLQVADCRIVLFAAVTASLQQQITAPHTAWDDDALLAERGHPLPDVRDWPDDTPLAIVFTSGTSGRPKGALLTVGAFHASALASRQRIGAQPDDRWLCVLPLYHVGGLSILLRSAIDGSTVTLMSQFSEQAVNEALHIMPITLLSVVPTMLYRMLNARLPHQMPRALRLVLLGGAAPTPELLSRAVAMGVPVATTYGMTEAASQIATAMPPLLTRKPGTVGTPLLGFRVRIVDGAGVEQPPGAHGEILVSGPTLLREYVNDPLATGHALRDGWLHSGDIGFVDAEGDLFVLQRRSDLIISGGENVYPAEVEAVLLSHPQVAQALVVGVPDDEWGQRVAALVVPNGDMTPDELIAFCQGRLARYKQPRLVRLVPQLPLTASGKPSRRAALKELLQEFT